MLVINNVSIYQKIDNENSTLKVIFSESQKIHYCNYKSIKISRIIIFHLLVIKKKVKDLR